jgi:hypothetical protein
MPWQLERLPHLTGYTIEWAEPANYFLSRLNRIYHTTDLDKRSCEVGEVDTPFWRKLVSRSRPGQRLLRFMVYNLIRLANGDLFITFDKSVGLLRDGKYFELNGLARPCRVLRSGCAVNIAGDVYFGEYLPNQERGVVHIYRYRSGAKNLEIIYTFPRGTVRHIHGIYVDPFTSAIYCLTGDADSECRIIRSNDDFSTIEIVGMGDESWRAVSILFDQQSLYYGTDAEFCSNEIFSVDRVSNERRRVGRVSGTVFYSKRVGQDSFFTTTAENAPSQPQNVAGLWHLDQKGELSHQARFEKDRWNKDLFMFGTINLPFMNDFDDRLYFNLVGVKGDNSTFCLRRV